MEKPSARDSHLLQIIDPTQAVAVGNDVGKCVEMDQQSYSQTAEKGGPLGGRRPPPQLKRLFIKVAIVLSFPLA